MHIPAEMLSGSICPVSTALSAVGVAGAAVALFRHRPEGLSPARFALTSAAVFGLQMLNYPVWNGISGHLIGGALAATLLGVPAGVLSVALVLAVQALLFADGGLAMLGANVLNMALLGAGAAGLLNKVLENRLPSTALRQGFTAACSVLLAVGALCVELACSGILTASVAGTLLGVHAALALVEGVATALLAWALTSEGKETATTVQGSSRVVALILACLALSPFASASPDAFEWTMGRFDLLPAAPNFALAPFADYVAFGSGLAASALGLAAVAALGFALALPLSARARVAR